MSRTTTSAVDPRNAGLVKLSHLLFVFGTKPFEKAACCLWACCAWAITWTQQRIGQKGLFSPPDQTKHRLKMTEIWGDVP